MNINGMVYLEDDVGANRMIHIAQMHEKVHIYVVHPLSQPDVVEDIPLLEYNVVGPNKVNLDDGPLGTNEKGPNEDCEVVMDKGPNEVDLDDGSEQVGEGINVETDEVGEQSEDSALDIQFDDSEEEIGLKDTFGEDVVHQSGQSEQVNAAEQVTKVQKKGKDKETGGSGSKPKRKRGMPFKQVEASGYDSNVNCDDGDILNEGDDVDKEKFPTFKLLKDMMERWEANRRGIAKYEGHILPNIRKKLDKESSFSNNWIVRRGGEFDYEVRHFSPNGDKYTINLLKRECSCRKWYLTGLPCCHAIPCMRDQNIDVDQYVPDYYRKEAYAACYSHMIYPTNGQNLWTKTEFVDLQPPPIKRQPGRPKKKRNREAGAKKLDTIKSTCKLPPPPPTAGASSSQPAPTQTAQAALSSQPAPTQTAQAAQTVATSTTHITQAATSTTPAASCTQPAPTNKNREKLPLRKNVASATNVPASVTSALFPASSTQPAPTKKTTKKKKKGAAQQTQ
ncbi:hypothetical protein QL285_096968 [Trifolium repens]|nr:hypothetical protein QL285_096968 [Trifolium repens]